MKTSIQQRFADALIARGEKEVKSSSRKYRCFTRAAGGFYWLGKSGALRFGKTATGSIALLGRAKDALLAPFAPTTKTPAKTSKTPQANTTAATAEAPSPSDNAKTITATQVKQMFAAKDKEAEIARRVEEAGLNANDDDAIQDIIDEVEAEQRPDPTKLHSDTPKLSESTGTNSTSPKANLEQSAIVQTAKDGENAKPSGLAAILQRSIEKETGNNGKPQPPHLIVEARAGTGKTTTLIEGLKVMRGLGSKLTPSPQQKAVWDSMALSKDARSVCFVAFNKSIATELQNRVPQGCDAMTMHSMGNKAVVKAFGRQEPTGWAVSDIISEILETDIRELRRTKPVVLKATEDLVSLCKMNLVEGVEKGFVSILTEELGRLASYYEVDLNGSRAEVYDLVPKVLLRCMTPKGKISFDDMIWLPVVLDLPVFKYDLLLVDEAQDLNRCQQALAKKAGRRLILCGDPKQAIYGFAGADAESMPRMARELTIDITGSINSNGAPVSSPGCITLPLTVTRRCGKAIVREANKYVPDFEAFATNCEGKISTGVYPIVEGKERPKPHYTEQVNDGDMILCRVNAPLVSQCFRFIKAGKKAHIQGRDIGQGLISTIKKMKADTVPQLVGKLSDWLHSEEAKEQAKRNPNEARMIALQDRHDCLVCFTDGAETIDAVIKKIEAVFTDDKESPGIKLSSVHKAKGLEARRVFVLQPKGASMPHPMAKSEWQRSQEYNILYVAITRAIEELVYVS